MPRIARAVAAGVPHHVTQRGNRRQTVFFADADYRRYVELLRANCKASDVAVWAWCLMPNHVHLVVVPAAPDGLAKAVGDTHRDYTRVINRRYGWTGYLWQGRFGSCAMDEPHCLAAIRYVERNPERAGLVADAADWPWSSARAHLGLGADGLVEPRGLDHLVPDWRAYLDDTPPGWQVDELRRHVRSGRPLGSAAFLERLEAVLGRRLRTVKPGRPSRKAAATVDGVASMDGTIR